MPRPELDLPRVWDFLGWGLSGLRRLLSTYLPCTGGLAGLQWAWVGGPVGGARFQGRVCTRPPTPSGRGGISERFLASGLFAPGAAIRSPGFLSPRDWQWPQVLEAEQFIKGEIRFRAAAPTAVLMDEAAGGSPGTRCGSLDLTLAAPPPSPPGLPGHPALSGWTLSWGDPASGRVLRLGPAWPR